MLKSGGLNSQEPSHTGSNDLPFRETRSRQNHNQENLAEQSLSDEDTHSYGIDAEDLSCASSVTIQSDK